MYCLSVWSALKLHRYYFYFYFELVIRFYIFWNISSNPIQQFNLSKNWICRYVYHLLSSHVPSLLTVYRSHRRFSSWKKKRFCYLLILQISCSTCLLMYLMYFILKKRVDYSVYSSKDDV